MPIPNLQSIVHERLKDLRLKPVTAAREAGLNRNFIYDILRGKKDDVRGANLVKLSEVLLLDPGKFAQGIAEPVPGSPKIGEPAEPHDEVPSDRGVPVRGAVAGALAHSFRFTGETVEFVPWPPALIGTKGLYAIFVARNSMAPEHKEGELRFVNPNRPPRPGDTVVVTARTHAEAKPEAYLGHLVARDAKAATIAKINPKATVRFDAKFVEAVEKVMTVNELFGA
jgi:phage repressor protein C with HTH and peptisase S24 domain